MFLMTLLNGDGEEYFNDLEIEFKLTNIPMATAIHEPVTTIAIFVRRIWR